MDFAQLRFEVAEPQMPEHDTPDIFEQADSADIARFRQPSQQTFANSSARQNGRINLNTASFEQLQTLPHIGFDRALDILALRPITHLSQLSEIKGLGPARLADIERAGVGL